MRERCYNPLAANYRYYGGKGVTICPEWEEFAAFQTWALAAGFEPGLELDRDDPDRHYGPDNCRWATKRDNVKRARILPLALDQRLTAYASEHGISRSKVIEAALDAFLPAKRGGAK